MGNTIILVLLNQLQFEYDILSLVKAFYPSGEVKIIEVDSSRITSNTDMIHGENRIHVDSYSQLDYPFVIGKESRYNKQSREDTSKDEIVEVVIQLEFSECCIQGILLDSIQLQKKETFEKDKCSVELEVEDERPEIKNKLKRLLYDLLSKETGKILPWGTLTGIRPTKIVMKLRESGMNDQEIRIRMKDTYYLSEEKVELCLEIIHQEEQILSTIHQKEGYSLYIGIPFCPTTCLYCSFTSYPRKRFEQQIDDYLEALFQELEFVKEACKNKILDTIYIGGGTPTTLTAQELEQLLERIITTFSMDTVQEFTVEAGRADSITREKLEVLYQYGVNRISVNPQTMKEETLQIIGRHHTVEQVKEAFVLAREVGFTNINMDLIVGLPGEDKEDVSETLQAIECLNPDSVTIHSLAIKRGARLSEWVTKHGTGTLCNSEEIMSMVQNSAKNMNMKPYYLYRQKNMAGNFENVGYARSNANKLNSVNTQNNVFGIYNIIIMEEKQNIMAVGAGSISKVIAKDGSMKRCDCVKDVQLYIDNIEEMINRKRELLKWED